VRTGEKRRFIPEHFLLFLLVYKGVVHPSLSSGVFLGNGLYCYSHPRLWSGKSCLCRMGNLEINVKNRRPRAHRRHITDINDGRRRTTLRIVVDQGRGRKEEHSAQSY